MIKKDIARIIFFLYILYSWFTRSIVSFQRSAYLLSWVVLPIVSILWLVCNTQIASSSTVLKGTGLPVPRFISLRSDLVNLRTGPGMHYPVEWIYTTCRNYPIEIIAEFDTWRRIRDWEGSEGWIHQSMLDKRRTFIILGQRRNLRMYPTEDAPLLAKLDPGIIGNILQCPVNAVQYCQVEISNYIGWLKRGDFWGVLQNEFLR